MGFNYAYEKYRFEKEWERKWQSTGLILLKKHKNHLRKFVSGTFLNL